MSDNFDINREDYAQADFIIEGPWTLNPSADFAVITAYNPVGEKGTSLEANQQADAQLKRDLEIIGPVCRVIGCSRDQKHREPGWAAVMTLEQAVEWGRRYRQDAIFFIVAGELHLIACADVTKRESLGAWKNRLVSDLKK